MASSGGRRDYVPGRRAASAGRVRPLDASFCAGGMDASSTLFTSMVSRGGYRAGGADGGEHCDASARAASAGNREQLAEDVVSLREQVSKLKTHLRSERVEKQHLQQELLRTRSSWQQAKELNNIMQLTMGSPKKGISQGYRFPDTPLLVANLQQQVVQQKATAAQLGAELRSLQGSLKANQVLELQRELFAMAGEVQRLSHVAQQSSQRVQDVEAAAHRALMDATHGRALQLLQGAEGSSVGAFLGSASSGGGGPAGGSSSLRRTLQAMYQAHQVLLHEAEQLRAVFPGGLGMKEFVARARQSNNTSGAPDVLDFLRSHITKLSTELSGQPGAPPGGSPTKEAKASSSSPSRTTSAPTTLAGPDLMQSIAHAVRKLRTLGARKWQDSPTAQMDSEQLVDVMALYVNEVRQLQGKGPLATSSSQLALQAETTRRHEADLDKAAAKAAQAALAASQASLSTTKTDLIAAQRELAEWLRRAEALEAKKSSLKAQLASANRQLKEAVASSGASVKEVLCEAKQLKAAAKAAQADLASSKADLTAAQDELSTTKADLAAAQATLSTTKTDLAAAQRELAEWRRKAEALEAEKSSLKTQLVSASQQLKEAAASSGASAKEALSEAKQLQAAAQAAQADLAAAQGELSTTKTDVIAAQRELGEWRRKAEALEAKESSLKAQLANANQQLAEAAASNGASVREALSEAKQLQAAAQGAQAALAASQADLAAAQDELSTIKADLSAARRELGEWRRQAETQLAPVKQPAASLGVAVDEATNAAAAPTSSTSYSLMYSDQQSAELSIPQRTAPSKPESTAPWEVVVHTHKAYEQQFWGDVYITLNGSELKTSGELLLPVWDTPGRGYRSDHSYTIHVPTELLDPDDEVVSVGLRMGDKQAGDVPCYVVKVKVTPPPLVPGAKPGPTMTFLFNEGLQPGPVNLLFQQVGRDAPQKQYTLEICTSEYRSASVEGQVYITLVGVKGAAPEVLLQPGMLQHGDASTFLCRGSTCKLAVSVADVGELSHVVVRLAAADGSTKGVSWALDEITVWQYAGTEGEEALFPFDTHFPFKSWLTAQVPRATLTAAASDSC